MYRVQKRMGPLHVPILYEVSGEGQGRTKKGERGYRFCTSLKKLLRQVTISNHFQALEGMFQVGRSSEGKFVESLKAATIYEACSMNGTCTMLNCLHGLGVI